MRKGTRDRNRLFMWTAAGISTFGAAAAHAGTTVIPVAGDTYVYGATWGTPPQADTNYDNTTTDPNSGLPANYAVFVSPSTDSAGNSNRGLMRFDLSGVGSTINTATLTFDNYFNASSYTFYRLTRDFTDTGATWNSYDGTHAWTTGGGDYDSSASASATVAEGPHTAVNVDVTALVQAAENAGQPFADFLIFGSDSGGGLARIDGSEAQYSGNPAGTYAASLTVDSSSVPEPATLGVLGAAGLILFRRRRAAC